MKYLPLILLLSGCATMIRPATQSVWIQSDPPGAECIAEKGGLMLADRQSPYQVGVPRLPAGGELRVGCGMAGYQDRVVVEPPIEDWGTSFVLGGLTGLSVDEETGSVFRYPDTVNVKLFPNY